jgi:hypothetical protein
MPSDAEPAILHRMFRLSRRFTTTLLWIAIALLPVRGFAAVMMPAVMMAGTVSTTVSAPADDATTVMPCHGASQDAGDASADATHTCSLCDLCHSSVAATTVPVIALSGPLEAQPHSASPPVLEPRAPDGLFRPPRTTLA